MNGDAHGTNPVTPSSWHSNVALVSGELNTNVGVASFDGFGGRSVSTSAGPTVSIVHWCVAGVPSTLPAASIARTANPCAPSARVTVAGDEHGVKPLPSTEHSNAAPSAAGDAANLNEATPTVSTSLGPTVITVSGGIVSMVKLATAGAPAMASARAAATASVCAPSPTSNACGDVHAAGAPPSSAHANVAVASSAWNRTSARVCADSAGGAW